MCVRACVRACVRVCVRACCHNTTVFHLQCSLFELMLNAMVMSGFCPPPPILWNLCPKFSPLCLVWVRTPLWPCERNQVLLASVSGVFVFLGVLPFLSHLLIGVSHMFSRNSVVTINGLPDMIFTVDHGRKAATQANNQTQTKHFFLYFGEKVL